MQFTVKTRHSPDKPFKLYMRSDTGNVALDSAEEFVRLHSDGEVMVVRETVGIVVTRATVIFFDQGPDFPRKD